MNAEKRRTQITTGAVTEAMKAVGLTREIASPDWSRYGPLFI